MRFFYLLILALAAPIFVAAQTLYDSVEGEYKWVTGERESIPSWAFQQQGGGRYVGISDPMLDSINGENQALLRAWFLSMFDNGITVKIMKEEYERTAQIATQSHSYYKYAQVVKFSPAAKSVTLRRGQNHTTKFGEYIAEYFVADSANEGSLSDIITITSDHAAQITGEYTIFGDEASLVKGKQLSELTLCATINGEVHSTKFNVSGGRERNTLLRYINDIELSNRESGRYWYEHSYACDDSESFVSSFSTIDGLWRALYESFIYALANNSDYGYTTKNVSQSYSDENSNDRNASMVRSSFSGEVTMQLQTWGVLDNYVTAQWWVESRSK